jgi:hypothetical protein
MDTKEKKGKIIKKKPVDSSEMTLPEKRPDAAFYKRKTLKELAREQGIKPIIDITQLTGHWPEGADFDSFYETAVNSRKHAENK